jgi:hypothetical protein
MKLTKTILLGLGIVSIFGMTSCKKNDSTADTSSLATNIANKWFSLNKGDKSFSDVYSTKIYDGGDELEDKTKGNYYSLYAPTDIEASIRFTLTPVSKSNFENEGRTTNSVVNYLQTVSFSSTIQSTCAEKIKNKENDINTAVTGFEASVQTTWSKNLNDYSVSSSSLVENKDNYVAIYYIPMFFRQYSSGSATVAAFIAVPVKADLVQATYKFDTDGNSTLDSVDNTLAQKYLNENKYITYNYSSSTKTIA